MYTAVSCIIPLLHTCIFYPISKCNVCQSYCATKNMHDCHWLAVNAV